MSRAGVEDIRPLSPIQQGMLIDSTSGSYDPYVVQLTCVLHGDFRPDLLRAAWQALVRRHPVLRTSVHWRGLSAPVQVVHQVADVPYTVLEADPAEPDGGWARACAKDRRLGFDLGSAPLLRVTVLRTGPATHRLLWTHHHLVLDGWSVAAALAEVLDSYRVLATGGTPRSDPAPAFSGYLHWSGGMDRTAAEDRWRTVLAGCRGPLPLPGDLAGLAPGGGVASGTSGEVGRRDLAGQAEQVRRWAVRHRTTAAAVHHLGWALVLAAYGAGSDTLFGTTVNLRAAGVPGALSMLGPLINTVPVRLRATGDRTLADCLSDLSGQLVPDGPTHHLGLPSIKAVSEVPIDRPLFETAVAVENYPADRDVAHRLPGVRIDDVRWRNSTGIPLSVVVVPDEGAVTVSFRRDRFDEWTAARLLDHFLGCVDAIVAADPGDRLADLPRPVTRDPAFTRSVPALPALPLHVCFAARAAAAPNAPAVDDGSERLSYSDLDRRAAALAAALHARGVRPGSRVVLLLDPSADLLAGILAVLRLGAAYVPIAPGDPAARQREIHRLARPTLTVLPEGADPVGWGDCLVLPVDGTAPPAPDVVVGSLDTAYVLFTSGSTGTPKGVLTPHRALANYLAAAAQAYRLGPGTVTPAHSSPAFDLSVTSLLGPLAAGGEVRILPAGGAGGPLSAHLASGAGPGTVKLTPAHLAALQDRRPRGRADTVVVGGEALRGDVLRGWVEDNPDAEFVNEYGPTEATVGCVAHRVTADTRRAGSVPIGTPMAGTGVRILDEGLRAVPDGAVGELFLTGDSLATGYLGRAGRTAESFLPDPEATVPGARMYRTGDLVRLGPHGLVYLGRRDHQVKVRGVRVEPAEIEAKLIGLPGVAAAAVVGDPEHGLKAFVVPAAAGRPAAADLMSALELLLPRPMVPARYEFLSRIPESAAGKVDREALRGRPAGPAAGATIVAPRTPTEAELARLWADVLGLRVVGVTDDFFALGGDSLSAMSIGAQAPPELGRRFGAGDVLACRTVRALAGRIDAAAPAPPGRPGAGRLSPAQLRFFVLHRLDPVAYNTATAVMVGGVLDDVLLERAVASVVARHEVLRTAFELVDGVVTGTVRPGGPVRVAVTDLRDRPPGEARAEARRLAERGAARPFDLAAPPLLRVEVFAVAPEEHILLLVMHHIVSDGRSQAIVVDEVCAAYAALLRGEPPDATASAQYAAVVPADQDTGADLAYWRSRLAVALPEVLVADAARPDTHTQGPAAEVRLPVDPELWQQVQAAGRDAEVGTFSVLLAALRLLLARFHRAPGEISIGTPVSLRGTAELAGVVGPLINTLPLRGAADLGRPVLDLLRAEQGIVADALRHSGIPFEELVRELAGSGDGTRSPLFDVLLDFQRISLPDARSAGLTVAEFDLGPPPARFDLQVDVWESGGQASVRFLYRADLFDRAPMRALAEAYLTVLRGIAADHTMRAGDVPLHPPAAPAGDGPGRDYGPQLLVGELIARQAARTPEAVALVAPGIRLSYRELDEAAGRWADRLVAAGVGPEVAVGVLLDRSAELIVAALAVLRAGGVYLPLDPGFPDERLRYVAADAGAAVVLTDARHADRLAAGGPQILRIDTGPDDNPVPAVARPVPVGSNAAYVLYTSGSTGRPKGVAISQAALANRLLWAQEQFKLTPADRVLHKTPIGFDVSVWELFWPLLAGSTTVIAEPGGHRDPEYLAGLIRAERVSTVHFVPSLLRVLVDSGLLAGCTTLTRVICSGEVLPAALYRDLRAATPARVSNLYGPTEAAIDVTWWEGGDGAVPYRIPIGRPVANTSVHVLDGALREQPANAVGELCIGGVQVGRGYLGRPALTADMFRPDPFGPVPGSRLYRTGDIARLREDGVVDYLGRMDDQVKIRGQRVEIGEIESTLAGHPAVRDCAVRVVDSAAGPRLQACCVLDRPTAGGELAAYLAGFLPQVMVPSAWTEVDRIPRTASGKVDRAALPPAAAAAGEAVHDPPAGEQERALAAVWRDVLGTTADPARDQSFFAAGGDSILALRLIARAGDGGLQLTVADVFRAPTLAAMAARATRSEPWARADDVPFALLDPAERVRLPGSAVDAYPMTALQTGMVFHALYRPGTTLYKNLDSVLLRSRYDHAALSAAVRAVVARHPVLRTSFDLTGERELQVVHGAATGEVTITDLRGLDPDAARRSFRDWADAQLRADWDFGSAPLIRFHVHLLGAGLFRLSLPHHHAILDGWSLGSLAAELVDRYLQELRGAGSEPVPAGRNAFRAHVAEELRVRASGDSLAFWTRTLDGAPVEPLLARPGRDGAAHHTARVSFPREQTAALRAWVGERGLSLKAVLFAVHCAVLAAASGRDELVTGMTVHGRSADEEGLTALGLFLNTVPARVAVAGLSWQQLAERCSELERSVMPHRHVPAEALRRGRDGAVPVDTLFNFTNFHVLADVLDAPPGDRPFDVVEQESHTTSSIPYVANLDLSPGGDRLSIELTADLSALVAEDVDALAEFYRSALSELLGRPAEPARPAGPPVRGFRRPGPVPDLRRGAGPVVEVRSAPSVQTAPTPTEVVLGRLWAEVLGVALPDRTDDFFALGGHSLVAMRLKARIRQVLGVELSVATIFERPRLDDLAAVIDRSAPGSALTLDEPVRGGEDGPAPASWAQAGLWDVTAALPGLPLFGMPMAARITGPLDPEALLAAVGAVVDRHEALRTHLSEVDGELIQVVAAPGGFRPVRTDLRGVPAGERAAHLAERKRALVRRPFDLGHGPLVRAELVREDTDRWLLLFSMHHAVADGWSVGVIVGDITAAYGEIAAGRSPSWLGPPAVQYGDVARWQRDRFRGGRFTDQVEHWRRTLAPPLAPMETATDRPRRRDWSLRDAEVDVLVPAAAVTRLTALGRERHVSLFMLLATAYALLLRERVGGDDIRIGTLSANRGRGAVAETVGLLMNPLVLRFDLAGAHTFDAALERVSAAIFAAYANGDVPFDALVGELDLAPEARPQLYRHLLVLQTAPMHLPSVDGLAVTAVAPDGGRTGLTATTLDLALVLAERDGALAGSLTYRPDLFDRSTVERVAAEFVASLVAVADRV